MFVVIRICMALVLLEFMDGQLMDWTAMKG